MNLGKRLHLWRRRRAQMRRRRELKRQTDVRLRAGDQARAREKVGIDFRKSFEERGFCAAVRPDAAASTLAPYCVLHPGHETPSHCDPYGEQWTDVPTREEDHR